jgi:hypothetical protein
MARKKLTEHYLYRFYIVGIRPIQLVPTDDLLYTLKYDWDTGKFINGFEFRAKAMMSNSDVEEITEEEFIQYVEQKRGRDLLRTGEIGSEYRAHVKTIREGLKKEEDVFAIYEQMNEIENKAKAEGRKLTEEETTYLTETRKKTYEMFREKYEMGEPWSEYR